MGSQFDVDTETSRQLAVAAADALLAHASNRLGRMWGATTVTELEAAFADFLETARDIVMITTRVGHTHGVAPEKIAAISVPEVTRDRTRALEQCSAFVEQITELVDTCRHASRESRSSLVPARTDRITR